MSACATALIIAGDCSLKGRAGHVLGKSAGQTKKINVKKSLFYCPALGTGTGLDNKNDTFFKTRFRKAEVMK